jgi:AcrR family transcriptional regulator
MSRSSEQTKERLRAAALVEFAEHGVHGTTVERIAARAGVNKERLYAYFGDKQALFAEVLVDQLDLVAAAVPLEIATLDDVGEYAGRTFDYHRDHPDLFRLIVWQGMADAGAAPDEAARGGHHREKVAAMAAAQRAGVVDDAIPPAHLLFLLLSLASWWWAAPHLARMLEAGAADGSAGHAARRAAVVEAARRLAAPGRAAG